MSRKLNLFTNIIAISLAPIWMGFAFWLACILDGKQCDYVRCEKNIIIDLWKIFK